MASPPPPPAQAVASPHPSHETVAPPPSPKYGGFTRFEIELDFVQSLANPSYLLHLASSNTPPSHNPASNTSATASSTITSSSNPSSSPPVPLLSHPPFIAYLSYLQYWASPPYTKFLNYPGPTLKHLQLLQNARFREEILKPEVVGRLMEEDVRAAVEVHANGR